MCRITQKSIKIGLKLYILYSFSERAVAGLCSVVGEIKHCLRCFALRKIAQVFDSTLMDIFARAVFVLPLPDRKSF